MFDLLVSAFDGFIQSLLELFPVSPFRPFIEQFANLPYLGYVNWFFPVGDCLTVCAAWLTSIALFYVIMVVARWVKVVGD